MRREEKRRRFNEAVVNTLFPQSPPPPQVVSEEEENETVNILRDDFDMDLIPDDLEESGCSACDDTDGESGPRRKLPRAQRKRLRKKKLKEDASRRGNITGPLLPSTSESEAGRSGGGGGVIETEPPGVRRNAAKSKVDATADNSGENKKKLKEDASRHGIIIGPLLPSTGESEAGDCGGGGGDVETEPPDVRHNATEKKVDATADNSGEEAASANKKKLKHRRMAKRLAKERLKSSNMENCNQNDQPCAEDVGST